MDTHSIHWFSLAYLALKIGHLFREIVDGQQAACGNEQKSIKRTALAFRNLLHPGTSH